METRADGFYQGRLCDFGSLCEKENVPLSYKNNYIMVSALKIGEVSLFLVKGKELKSMVRITMKILIKDNVYEMCL